MRYFITYLIPFFIAFACSPRKIGILETSSLTIKIDTLQIDSGDHLFYLAHGIPAAKLSPDEKYLYFYDGYMHSIDQVDLQEKKYASTIQLESDGPKGVPTRQQMVIFPKEMGIFSFTLHQNLMN